MTDYTVYIDEAGDLGFGRGTRWFVLSAAIVKKENESSIRQKLSQIKNRLNIKDIHLKDINDFYRRAYIVRECKDEEFIYVNVIADTSMMAKEKIGTTQLAYNFMCKILLERVSWFLRDRNGYADVILSSRGTSRDGELITYITEKLLPYGGNEVCKRFEKILAKSAGSWDLLQLADICATSTFLAYEINGLGYRTPCFIKILQNHIYQYSGRISGYGIKYFSADMQPADKELSSNYPCR